MSRVPTADVAALKARLAECLDDWVPRYFVQARADGRAYWRLGSLAGEAGQSLVINRSGARRGSWHDFQAGAHGGVLDLWMAARGLTNFRDGLEEAARYLADPAVLAALERAPAAMRPCVQDDDAGRTRAARGIFVHGKALPGTLAEAYLLQRGIALGRLARLPGALRFHDALRCPETYRETGQLRPAMLAAIIGPDGAFSAVHRTFLERTADARAVKATDMRKTKQSLGPCKGGFIPLTRGASGQPWRGQPMEPVYVSEGIEDGLSVALALPQVRVIAAISLGNMCELPRPPGGGRYVLCAQNDEKPDACAAFERGREKLATRGLLMGVVRPPPPIKDWNDWARALQDRAGTDDAERLAG